MKQAFLGGVATVVSSFISPLSAQQADELEPVLVTGSRAERPISDVGSAFTVITREEIERSQAIQVVDLLRNVPGVDVSRSGGFGSLTSVRIRGAESDHVLVLIDGVEVNDPASNDLFRFEQLLLADVERIEIVRGAQSALYGSDAIGGVIQIFTREAGSGRSASISAEGGSFGTYNMAASGAIGGTNGRLRASVQRFDTGGTNIAREGNEDDGFDNTTLALSGGFRPAEHFDLALDARYLDATNEFDATDFTTGLPADSDRVSESKRFSGRLAAALEQPGLDLQHRLSITYLDTEDENFADGLLGSSTESDEVGIYAQTEWLAFSHGRQSHRFIAAIDHERTDFSQRGMASDFGDPNFDEDLRVTGTVLEYLGNFDALAISASGRYDFNSEFEDVATYRFTSAYTTSYGSRWHASVGIGRKAPTFIERFGFFPDQFVGNPDLEPEESFSWDIGVEQRLWKERLVVDITYFNQDLDREINGFFFDPQLGTFTAVNEDGESKREGVEISVEARPLESLTLRGSYTYTDANEPDGLRELRRARHLASLTAAWDFLEGRGDLYADLDFNGTQPDLFFPPFPEPSQRVELDNFTLLQVGARYRLTPRLMAFARGENLLDEDYEEVFGFVAPGRAGYAGIRYSWN